jgi:hypothetical protein
MYRGPREWGHPGVRWEKRQRPAEVGILHLPNIRGGCQVLKLLQLSWTPRTLSPWWAIVPDSLWVDLKSQWQFSPRASEETCGVMTGDTLVSGLVCDHRQLRASQMPEMHGDHTHLTTNSYDKSQHRHLSLFFSLSLIPVLDFELRALHLLESKCSTT